MNSFFWDLQLQHEVIETHLSGAFPSLVRVAFSAYIIWERQSSDEAWRVFIPHIHREAVVKTLLEFHEFADYGDCYHRLFTLAVLRLDPEMQRVTIAV